MVLTAKIIFSVNLFSYTGIVAAVVKSLEVAQLAFNFTFISSLFKHASWQNVSWIKDEAAS